MARKRRGAYRPIQKPAAAQDNRSESRRALDGFINTLAYLGEASDLNKANDYERHTITRDYELLTVLYRENWLAKRIIDTPCEDMTRAWYSISSEIEQDKLDEIAKLEAKHHIKQELTNGMRWARLYGGAAAVIVLKGQEDLLDQPLDYDTLTPGCFRGLIIVDRTNGLYPSLELEEDMDDPEFGYPMYYNVILDNVGGESMKIHHSRMIPLHGRMLPIQEEINEDYWGASELEHIYEELQKRNATSANIAQLIFQANVSAMKIADFAEALAMGTENQKQKIMESVFNMNRIRNSFGMILLGSEDSYEQHPYSFAGIAEVYESFMMDMAGAAEIPATKLFGRSPQGMNATGESDMKNYYEMLAQLQERNLRPAIEKLLPIMAMSLWGQIPEDMEVVFEPLMTTTPGERAEIMAKQAGAIIQAYSAGLLPQKYAIQELQKLGKDIAAWTGIDDELLEKASGDFEEGEEMQDPMGMMGPGMEETPPGPPRLPEAPKEQPADHPVEESEQKPEEGQQEEIQVKDAADLKQQVMKAAEAGDIDLAKRIVAAYREQKTAKAENQDRRKPARSGFISDMMRSIVRFFRGRDWSEADHPRGQPENAGWFAPKGGGGSGKSSEEKEKSPGSVANSPQTGYNGSNPRRAKAPMNPEAFQKSEPSAFRTAFHTAKAAVAKIEPEKAWRVDSSYTDEDYADMDCFVTKGGSTVAVHHGDIVSVCKHPDDTEVTGSDLLEFARSQGGKKLDAFAGLYGFYTRNGFEPVSYCEFADVEGIRPPDWVRGRDDPEPVIFFKYTGRTRGEIWKDHGELSQEYVTRNKPAEGYNEAQKIRDDSLEE